MRRLCVLLLAYALALSAGFAAARPVIDANGFCRSQPVAPRDHAALRCDQCCRLPGPGLVLLDNEAACSLVRRRAIPADWPQRATFGQEARVEPSVRARGPPAVT